MWIERLFSPLLGERDLGQGWRVLDWDAEQGPTLALVCGQKQLLIELGPRSARDAYAKTRRFNLYVRDPFTPVRSLSEFEHELVARLVRHLSLTERRLPVVARAPASNRTIVREIEVERMLVRESSEQYYLNPYAGCLIGCPFCFVDEQADLSRALSGEPRQKWGRWLDVKINAPDVLRREVRAHPPGTVRLSPILTDPYQAIEKRYRITRRCLEVLLEADFTPVILTRAARIVDDVELLRRFPRALVGLSVPTDDDRVRKLFEPGGDPIDRRIEALRKLHAAGLRTFAVVQPILPMNPEQLISSLAPLVKIVRIDRLHYPESVRHIYREHGYETMLSDAWIESTRKLLTDGFEARGVRVDDLERLQPLLA